MDSEREFEDLMAPRAQHDTDEIRLFLAGCFMSLVAVAILVIGYLCGF